MALGYCVAGETHFEAATLLLKWGASSSIRDVAGMSPLIFATQNSAKSLLPLLMLAPGVDMAACDERGWTALHWAAAVGEPQSLKLVLMRSGVDASRWTNFDGETCLHLAAREGRLDVSPPLPRA